MAFARPSQLLGVPTYTHQVEVHKYADGDDEPWDNPDADKPWDDAFELVWAVIEPLPSSVEGGGSDTQGRTRFRIVCDPCVMTHEYFVIDPNNGWTYQVVWIAQVIDPQFGLARFAKGYGHMEGVLERVEGLV